MKLDYPGVGRLIHFIGFRYVFISDVCVCLFVCEDS